MKFKEAGFAVIIVSNELDILRFIYTDEKVIFLQEQEVQQFDFNKFTIAPVYLFLSCPVYGLKTSGVCLKPAFSILLQPTADLILGLEISWIIGFNLSNLESGNIVDFLPVLVSTSYQKAHDITATPFSSFISNSIEAFLYIELETSKKLHIINSISKHIQSIPLHLYSLATAPVTIPMASRRLN